MTGLQCGRRWWGHTHGPRMQNRTKQDSDKGAGTTMVVCGQQGPRSARLAPEMGIFHGPWARTSRFQPQAGGAMPCRRFTSGNVHCACTGPGLDAGDLRMSRTQSLPSGSSQPSGRRRPRTHKLIEEQNGHQRCSVLRGGGCCCRAVGRGKGAGAGRRRWVQGGSGEAVVGLDWTPWAVVSHRRLSNVGVIQAG